MKKVVLRFAVRLQQDTQFLVKVQWWYLKSCFSLIGLWFVCTAWALIPIPSANIHLRSQVIAWALAVVVTVIGLSGLGLIALEIIGGIQDQKKK